MKYGFLDIAVTPAVRAVQAKRGVDQVWRDFKGHREFNRFGEEEGAFIAGRDSFYMASVSICQPTAGFACSSWTTPGEPGSRFMHALKRWRLRKIRS